MAKTLAGHGSIRVAAVTTARMSLKLEDHAMSASESAHAAHGMPHSPRASFWAAGLARIVTRPLDERDHACGNEVVAYPPLSHSVTCSAGVHARARIRGRRSRQPVGRPQLPQQLRGSFRPVKSYFSRLEPPFSPAQGPRTRGRSLRAIPSKPGQTLIF